MTKNLVRISALSPWGEAVWGGECKPETASPGLRKAFPSASLGGSVGVSLTRDSLGGATWEVCLGNVGQSPLFWNDPWKSRETWEMLNLR